MSVIFKISLDKIVNTLQLYNGFETSQALENTSSKYPYRLILNVKCNYITSKYYIHVGSWGFTHHATGLEISMLLLKFFCRGSIISNFGIIQQKLLVILLYPYQHLQKK